MPPLTPMLLERLAARYRAWDVSLKIPDGNPVSREQFLDMLRNAQPALTSKMVRVSPNDFDPDTEALLAFPREDTATWPSAQDALRYARPRAAMGAIPHFWQTEPALHHLCKNLGIPLFVSDPDNIPVNAAAIAASDIDAVLTETHDASLLAAYIKDKGITLPSIWISIARIGAGPWQIPTALAAPGITVFQEVHLMPGVAIFSQCPLLASRKEALFHAAPGYLIEVAGTQAYVTSLGNDPLPFIRLELVRPLHTMGTCACGEPLFALQ